MKLLVVFVVCMLLWVWVTPVLAAPPADAGSGAPPSSANENNDPDEDGRGPDRVEEHSSTDWNNGCQGGRLWGESDDNEGICGKPKLPSEELTTCKFDLFGKTPEVFPRWVDARDPAAEELYRIAEAHGYLEIHLLPGEVVQVLWWTPELGHAGSTITVLECSAEMAGTATKVVEPIVRLRLRARLLEMAE